MPNWIAYGSSHVCILIERAPTIRDLVGCSPDVELSRALAFWMIIVAVTLSLLVAALSLWPGRRKRGPR